MPLNDAAHQKLDERTVVLGAFVSNDDGDREKRRRRSIDYLSKRSTFGAASRLSKAEQEESTLFLPAFKLRSQKCEGFNTTPTTREGEDFSERRERSKNTGGEFPLSLSL
jgi:hypothetical protein